MQFVRLRFGETLARLTGCPPAGSTTKGPKKCRSHFQAPPPPLSRLASVSPSWGPLSRPPIQRRAPAARRVRLSARQTPATSRRVSLAINLRVRPRYQAQPRRASRPVSSCRTARLVPRPQARRPHKPFASLRAVLARKRPASQFARIARSGPSFATRPGSACLVATSEGWGCCRPD